VGSCGYDKETSSTIKGEEFVDKFIDCHFLKENSALGSYLYLVLSTAGARCSLHCATSHKVASPIPGEIIRYFN
jgi:hypothetical protein